jgi:IS30 family transposase
MSKHTEFTAATGTKVYFCEPRSPWQRGSNEHMNGLLRQYCPKATDLNIHKPQRLQHMAHEINIRPRRILGWTLLATDSIHS